MGDRQLTIGELAKRTGVATSALRYYEELGLIPEPVRVSGSAGGRYRGADQRKPGQPCLETRGSAASAGVHRMENA